MKNVMRLWKVFTTSKKSVLSIFLIGLLLGFVPNVAQLLFSSNEMEITRWNIEKYGSYAFRVQNYSDSDYAKLKNASNVVKIKKAEWNFVETEEEYFYMVYAPTFDLELMGLKLLKGTLPVSEQEIVIDERYLSEQGYNQEILGEKISIPVSDTETRKFTVTGILHKNTVWLDRTGEYYCLGYKGEESSNCIYASLRDYTNLETDCKYFEEILDGTLYPNVNLYLNLGYGMDGLSTFEQYDYIYAGLFAFLLIGMCLVLYNTTKMRICDTRENIAVMRLIGIRKNLIIFSFISNILFYLLVGILCGLLLSVLGVAGFHLGMYDTLSYFLAMCSMFPMKKIGISILICLGTVTAVLFPLFVSVRCKSPNQLLREEGLFARHKKKKEIRLFGKNTKLICWKLAKNNMRQDWFKNMISLLGIALGTVILTTAFYYLDINYSVIDGNHSYEYKIDLSHVEDYGEDTNASVKYELCEHNYGFSDAVQIHTQFVGYANIKVSPKKLSGKYEEFLSQDPENYRKILMNKDIDTGVYVLGYEDTEIERLYKENGMAPEKLLENETIVLDYVYDPSMKTHHFSIPFHLSDEVAFREKDNSFLKVKNTVSKLTIYPENNSFTMVFIVNLKTYEKLFGTSLPDAIYLNKVSEQVDLENMETLKKNRELRIGQPKHQRETMRKEKRNIFLIVSVIFSICIGVAVLLIYSSYYVKVYMERKEYALLHTIGLSVRNVEGMILLEMVVSYLLGVSVSFFVSFVLTQKVFFLRYPYAGTYFYKFPIEVYGFAVLLSFLFSCCVWYFIRKKLKTVLNVHVLKSL